MNNIDLNIDNYELDDLLELFKLQHKFTKQDLKRAKKIVLQTHPDKSGLPKEYFLFFTKAYKMVYSIYIFHNKDPNMCTEYIQEYDKERTKLLTKFTKSSQFNKKFNELFEKNNIVTSENKNGYGTWLKSDDDLDDSKTTLSSLHETFENKKKQTQDMIKKETFKCIDSDYGSDLLGELPENYTSCIFSNLKYEDLKKAHKESIIPVSGNDINSIKVYKNEEELIRARSGKQFEPMSENNSKKQLYNEQYIQEQEDIQRAYKLAKQDEQVEKANNRWNNVFNQLTY
tara:strand:+ start:8721 stop:9578 length:858 start_codon:yes stop_codon:yes gene_type:complete